MADREMIEHISTSKMELFCARGLPEAELGTVASHIARCPDCGRLFVSALRRQKGATAVTFTLAPEFWLRHEHIDYDQLVELGDATLDAAGRELIDLHLKVCPPCREDARSFLIFREEIAPELEVSYAAVERAPAREGWTWSSWWGGLAWKPVYAGAVFVIAITIIGAALLLKRRAENLQAKQVATPQVSPASTPDNRAASVPSSPPTPIESPIEKPNSAEPVVVLNDRGGMITVDKGGNISGLEDVPAPTRDEIARVLMSERVEQPPILKELGGQQGSLRGSKTAMPFKLTSPLRTVIITDRPALKWDKAPGASSYHVYVNNPSGGEIARSEELSSDRTEWILPQPLKRGEIYFWTVVAVVDGKEIVSPGHSLPEMKFQVLSMSSLQQLNKLKKTRSHLALGVFYASQGMIAEAEGEFRILVRNNPGSPHAKKLLGQVQSWTRR